MIANNIDLCTACSYCVNICPQKCIEMKSNREGFLYPYINMDECIHCHKCASGCPVNNERDKKVDTKSYVFIAKDKEIMRLSSSGGAFPVLAGEIIAEGGIVYGAAFDKDSAVKHIRCSDKESLSRLSGSKYVQSDVSDIFQSVEKDLQAGQTVLFSGTPCQIGGLLSFLSKEYENLLTVDFVCHGVPSALLWSDYLKHMQAKYRGAVKSVSFRDKRNGWEKYALTISFQNGLEYSGVHTDDLYMKGFLSNLTLRKSCYECGFKGLNRCSDITLADYWHVKKAHPDYYNKDGVSVVLVNSSKGMKILEAINDSADIHEIPVADCISEKINRAALSSVQMNGKREAFFSKYTEKNSIKLLRIYTKKSLKARFYRYALKLIHRKK